MYSTSGIDAIATITELRSKTTDLIEHVRKTKGALLVQKNNEPFAVLLDWETYNQLMTQRGEPSKTDDRGPKRHGRHAASEGEAEKAD